MRGRRSVFLRAGTLEALLVRRCLPVRSRYDFTALSDEELEELAALAEQAEGWNGTPDWTPDDLATLERLGTKVVVVGGDQ